MSNNTKPSELEVLKAKMKVMEKAVTNLTDENTELKEQLDKLPETDGKAAAKEDIVITISKKKYAIQHGVIFEGKKYTKEELEKKTDVVKNLIEKGSTAVVAL